VLYTHYATRKVLGMKYSKVRLFGITASVCPDIAVITRA
jgi:hypothetical protein